MVEGPSQGATTQVTTTRHPKLRPDPGPPPLAGQVALFAFEEAPRQVRQLSPGPAIPSYGPFALESPPGPEPQPAPPCLLAEEESEDD